MPPDCHAITSQPVGLLHRYYLVATWLLLRYYLVTSSSHVPTSTDVSRSQPKAPWREDQPKAPSGFGLRPSFGLRISDFGSTPLRVTASAARHHRSGLFRRVLPAIHLLAGLNKDALGHRGHTILGHIQLGDVTHTPCRVGQKSQERETPGEACPRAARRGPPHQDGPGR